MHAASCAAAQAGDTTRIFSHLYFNGKIEKGDAQALAKRLEGGGIGLVFIRSPGGDMEEAVAIAEVLRASGLPLGVQDYCLSACALTFVLTDKHFIKKGGYLAFHAGGKGWPVAATRACRPATSRTW